MLEATVTNPEPGEQQLQAVTTWYFISQQTAAVFTLFLTSTYPYGSGCDLEVVQPAQGALSVGEVGSSQLVEGLQGHCPRSV